MTSLRRTLALMPLAALLAGPIACDSAAGTERGPQPATPFTYVDDENSGFTSLSGDLVMRSCSFSVREPTTGQYYADGQADTSPSSSTLIVSFPGTNQTKPAVGDYAVPSQATLTAALASPYGTLEGTGGTVKVREADGWRTVELKDVTVSGLSHTGIVNAVLACGL